jgi:hypothetical protein
MSLAARKLVVALFTNCIVISLKALDGECELCVGKSTEMHKVLMDVRFPLKWKGPEVTSVAI